MCLFCSFRSSFQNSACSFQKQRNCRYSNFPYFSGFLRCNRQKSLKYQAFRQILSRPKPPSKIAKQPLIHKTRNQLYLRVPWVRIPPTPPENSVCKRFLPFAGFFFFLHLWDFSVSSLLKIGSSLLNFLRFELWICSWRILSKAIRRRSYEITSNAPLRPFTIASADDSLEL